MSEPSNAALLIRLMEIKSELDRAKELYREQDRIIDILVARGKMSGIVRGHRISLVDQFATKQIVWKATACHRYVVDVQAVPVKGTPIITIGGPITKEKIVEMEEKLK